MKLDEILSRCDHTQLAVTATWNDIRSLCDEGMRYQTASVCIPPCYVKPAKEYVGERLAICTVIGFPNGYNATEIKVKETEVAIADGADEIDMVINIGLLKDKRYDDLLNEIKAIKEACGNHILKVIIETCLLTEEEIIIMCRLVTEAGADFIKTSTGFSKSGATREAVSLMRKHSGASVRVKAAGGIASLADAEEFIVLGADRLGTSRVVKIVKAQNNDNNQGGY
ncbi:MAG: deoxyribose-phosphate aldolase [Clostridia bacterium]|nr:deoxyribose-phosphate aldolase [Clostridia bacterium]